MSDRSWMYQRLKDGYINLEFVDGVNKFIEYAFQQVENGGTSRCPCSMCKNKKFQIKEEISKHLLLKGFVPLYSTWIFHGEEVVGESITPELESNSSNDENPYRDMVLDAMSADYDVEEQPPNLEAQKFLDMLKAADEPLWDGCKKETKLSACAKMMALKSRRCMTEACFKDMSALIDNMLPEEHKLIKNFYEAKKMLKPLGLGYDKIDVCPNFCMLYYKENNAKVVCDICKSPRYKTESTGNNCKNIAVKQLRYFPIIPRLKRLFMSPNHAKDMTWHYYNKSTNGSMAHPTDGEAWKEFDRRHPEFASSDRNVRMGLCTDGFSTFGTSAKAYSCWPVILTVYNLPPWKCMKQPFLFLNMVIPGPKSPGKNLDVFLQPLIDELLELWTGVFVYDMHKKDNFFLRAALIWTISDFPAYGMLSGWSTHGRLSCPYCMEKTKSFTLEHGGKPCFFDCHRKFLPLDHPFRRQKDKFKKNTIERDMPPLRRSGVEMRDIVSSLPNVAFGFKSGNQKITGFGESHNWVRRSIFWDLPYWDANLIRHNLDVMHIEKNFFDNIFNTLMDTDKTKDNLKARLDLEKICSKQRWMSLNQNSNGNYYKPKAPYCLLKKDQKDVCQWVKCIRFPDGYASNIQRCVNESEDKISGFKSHDCHVFMQRLLPTAFRPFLPKNIWETLVELSNFFRDICAKNLSADYLSLLEKNVVEIICKLEKIFPPSFFDSMEHLPIHIPYEAKVGGPVQYRWMYPFERYLYYLKKKVGNKAHVEGSIAEAYLIDEISNFTSCYFGPKVETMWNQPPRNDDGGEISSDERLSIFCHSGRVLSNAFVKRRLTPIEHRAIHKYVLFNCPELKDLMIKCKDELRGQYPQKDENFIDMTLESIFPEWLKSNISFRLDGIQHQLYLLAQGPGLLVECYNGYFVNGYKFHTMQYGKNKKTLNCGVCVKGSCYDDLESDYYGMVKEVIKLTYLGEKNEIVMFNCDWFDTLTRDGIRVHHTNGLIEVKSNSRLQIEDVFVFAHQCHQVYFTCQPGNTSNEWLTVIKTTARSRFSLNVFNLEENTDVDQADEICQPSTVISDDSLDQPLIIEHYDIVDNVDLIHAMNTSNNYSDESEDDIEFDSDEDEVDVDGSDDEVANEDEYSP